MSHHQPIRETWSVVVWNLNEARWPRPRSWAAVDGMDADVFLLNEARLPPGRRGDGARGGERTVGLDWTRPYGSAVLSRHGLVDLAEDIRTAPGSDPERAPLSNSRPGSWEAAVVQVPGFEPVTAVALYGLMDERSDASVHRSLSDLTPLLEDPRYGERVVIAGDLNTWTGWPGGTRQLARDESVLRRIEAFGLVDCLTAAPGREERGRVEADCPCSYGDGCRHTRTRRDARWPGRPYQMDYLFASRGLVDGGRLLECATIDLGEDSPSDHFPVRAVFAR